MRYDLKIKYNNVEIAIKSNLKPEESKYTLPDYLKFVREKAGDTHQKVHLLTDYPTQQCIDMENGEVPITKDFLELFTLVYRLPRKIIKLGVDENKSALANRICELRIGAGLTQKDASYELGITRTTYAGYETGRNEPDVQMIIKIANMYNVSLDYLCGRYGEY